MSASQTNAKFKLAYKTLSKIPVHLKVSYWELAGTMDSGRRISELESINGAMEWILVDRWLEQL